MKTGLLDLIPGAFFRANLDKHISYLKTENIEEIMRRVHYYNKLDIITPLSVAAPLIRNISREKSTYYYDLREYARYFPAELHLEYLFGDINISGISFFHP